MKYNAVTGKVKAKLPVKLGPAVDLLLEVQEARRKLAKVVEGLSSSEGELKEELLRRFKKQDLDGAKGKRGQCNIKRKDMPTAKDWPAVYGYIKKHDAFDLLQRRFNEEAVNARWDADEVIPGVDKFTVIKVSVTPKGKG
jgi:hypothetical protein